MGGVPPISPLLVAGVGHWPIQPCSEERKSGVEGVPLKLPWLRCASPGYICLTLREKGVEYELDILDPPFVVGWHPTLINERRET